MYSRDQGICDEVDVAGRERQEQAGTGRQSATVGPCAIPVMSQTPNMTCPGALRELTNLKNQLIISTTQSHNLQKRDGRYVIGRYCTTTKLLQSDIKTEKKRKSGVPDRMPLQQLVNRTRTERRVRKQRLHELHELLDLKVHQCALLKQIRDIRNGSLLKNTRER